MTKKAVLLMAYGGPSSLEDVEPYLLDVRGGRPTPAELVEEIKSRYAAIGGKSPLLDITRAQASALEESLNRSSSDGSYAVFVGMRHWFPYIREVVPEMLQGDFKEISAICMAPYYSSMSTQAYFEQFDKALAAAEINHGRALPGVIRISAWYSHPLFVEALAETLRQGLQRFPAALGPEGRILFSAHSLPAVILEQGDPYDRQLRETAQKVAGQVNLPPAQWTFCYQSAGARSTPWLGPSLKETIAGMAADHIKNILVAPIGFITEHVEILYDLDIEAKRQAQAAGIHLERTAALNTSPKLIQALTQIIQHGVQQ